MLGRTTLIRKLPRGRAPWSLALAGLLGLAAPAAYAQRVEKASVKAQPTATVDDAEPGPSGPTTFGTIPPQHGGPPLMASLVTAQPEGWEAFVKTGAVFSFGDGFFEKRIGTGWTTQVGLRQPLYRAAGPWMMFAEFGGGYSANPGLSNHPVTTSGTVFFPAEDHVHFEESFYDTQLVELQRYFVQGALGVYYYPAFLNSPGQRLFHVNARGGMRCGGMEAVYSHDVQVGLRTAVETHTGAGGSFDRNLTQFFPDARDPELFFGLFTSIGTGFTYYDACLFGRRFADITLSLDVEFGHDWFNTGAYGHNDPGFGSMTPTISLSFSF